MSYGQIYVDLGLATVTPTGGSVPMGMPDVAAAALAGGSASGIAATSIISDSAYLAASSTARAIATRFGDVINPADFGALFNGTSDDTTHINAANAVLPASGGILYYPAGGKIVATSSLTGSGLVVHLLNGITAGTTGVPLTNAQGGMGRDMWITTDAGRLHMGRAAANSTNSGLLVLNDTMANISGTSNTVNVNNTISGTCAGGALTMLVNTQVNAATGVSFVGFGSQITKGTTVTSPYGAWSVVLTAIDSMPGGSNVSGGMCGMEIDFNVMGPDNLTTAATGGLPASDGARKMLTLDGGNGAAPATANTQVSEALHIVNSGRNADGSGTSFGTLNPNSSFMRGVTMTGYFSQACIDLTGAQGLSVSGQPAFQAIKLSAGQVIAFDGSVTSTGRVAGAHTMLWNSTASATQLQKSTLPYFAANDNGIIQLYYVGSGSALTSGCTIQTGSGAPTASAPNGSLYMRADGSTGSRLYVNQGGSTTWAALAA